MIVQLLVKMFLCSAVLFGYYYFFLRNKRFHHYNRFYLLSISLLSLILPWVRIPVFLEPGNPTAEIVNQSIRIISVADWEGEGVENGGAGGSYWLSWEVLTFGLYLAVTLALVYFLLRSLMYIRAITRKYSFQQIDSLRFYNTTESGTPFSFFKSIFWNSELDVNSDDGQKIFRHELFHVKQKHSVDIMVMEIVSIFFWFNPFFFLIKREIRAIHEFLADQHAIEDENRHDYAELLVLQSLKLKRSNLTNHFFQNHIKRRIAMITQLKSKKYGYWSRLLVLPLGILIFCSIALYAQRGSTAKNDREFSTSPPGQVKELITIVVDAGHGGNDAGATNDAGTREKDLSLAIARQIKAHAPARNIKVIMTRDEDVTLPLKQRSDVVDASKASLLLSIHVASTPNDAPASGFDIFITNRNQQTLAKSRLLGESIANSINQVYKVSPIKQRKEQGIWVLDKVNCPAVLIECGYITNNKDLAFISETANQEKIAQTILSGVVAYLDKPVTAYINDTLPESIVLKDTVKLTQSQKKRQMMQSKELEARRAELEKKEQELLNKHRELQEAQQKFQRATITEKQLQQKALNQKQRELESAERRMAEAKLMETDVRERELSLKKRELEIAQQKFAQAGQDLLEERQALQRLDHKMTEQKLSMLQSEQKAMIENQQKLSLARQEMIEQKRAQIQRDNQQRLKKIEEARHDKLEMEQNQLLEQQKQIDLKRQELQEKKQKELESKQKKESEKLN